MNKRKEFEEDTLTVFRREINKYPVLAEEEQIKLFEEYNKTGSLELLDKLVKHNLRLSIKVAKKHLYNRKRNF